MKRQNKSQNEIDSNRPDAPKLALDSAEYRAALNVAVALFCEIYFVPKRKASRIAGKLLKSTKWSTFDRPEGFRRCESAWSVDFDPANGSLTLY